MPPVRPQNMTFSPWLVLLFHTLFSSLGVFSQLQASKGPSAAQEVSRIIELWSSGDGSDADDAKRLAWEALEEVMQTQLGIFFAASLMAGCCAGVTLATKCLFLGQLSATENSQLANRLVKFAAGKAIFLAIAPRSHSHSELAQWLALAGAAAYASMFTKLASLRGDALLSSPTATPAQHGRVLLLLGGILAQDISWVGGFWKSRGQHEPLRHVFDCHSMLWLFDALFVAVDAAFSLTKYAVHAVEHWQTARAEAAGKEREPWEGHVALLYWLELGADLTLGGFTLAHYCHLWWLHGLQLQLIDGMLFLDVRFTAAALARRVRGHLGYRRLQHQLLHSFPDASEDKMAEDPCPICFEKMRVGKLLPCSHVMHASCLCAWIQQGRARNFTCPLCRANLDVQPVQPKHRPRWLHLAATGAHGALAAVAAFATDVLVQIAEPAEARAAAAEAAVAPRALPQRRSSRRSRLRSHPIHTCSAGPDPESGAEADADADAEANHGLPQQQQERQCSQGSPPSAAPDVLLETAAGGTGPVLAHRRIVTRLQARLATAALSGHPSAGTAASGAAAVGAAAALAGPATRRRSRRIDGIFD